MGRRGRLIATAAVLLALLAPVMLNRDSFPLSTYPMYSRTRPAEVPIATAQGIDGDGERHRLSLSEIGGSDDPLIVESSMRSDIAAGRAEQRCQAIAARITDEELVDVEVVTERHDVVAKAAGRSSLVSAVLHSRCAVR